MTPNSAFRDQRGLRNTLVILLLYFTGPIFKFNSIIQLDVTFNIDFYFSPILMLKVSLFYIQTHRFAFSKSSLIVIPSLGPFVSFP